MTDPTDPAPAPSPDTAVPRPSAWQVWGSRLLALAGVFLVANLLAAVVGARMSEPLVFARPLAQVKHEQLDDLAADEGCVDVVAFGDSLAGFGFDPEVIAAAFPGMTAYNAALAGSVASIEDDWSRSFVLPALDPATVVLIPSSLAFAPDTTLASRELADWAAARETREGLMADADRTAADVLPLARYRSRLSDPEEWRRLVRGEEGLDLFRDTFDQTPDDIRAARGQVEDDRIFDPTTQQGAFTAQGTRQQLLAGWSIDPDEVEALRTTATEATAEGRRVVFVIPPVTQAYIDAHPNGKVDYDQYVETVRSLASELDLPLIDLSLAPQPPSDFVDTHHLNAAGATTFTTSLANGLRQAGIAPVGCGTS